MALAKLQLEEFFSLSIRTLMAFTGVPFFGDLVRSKYIVHAEAHKDGFPPFRLPRVYQCLRFGLISSITAGRVHTERICDEVECVSVMLDFIVKVSQVEPVSDIFFVYFAEVFVPFTSQEPGNPRVGIVAIGGRGLELIHGQSPLVILARHRSKWTQ